MKCYLLHQLSLISLTYSYLASCFSCFLLDVSADESLSSPVHSECLLCTIPQRIWCRCMMGLHLVSTGESVNNEQINTLYFHIHLMYINDSVSWKGFARDGGLKCVSTRECACVLHLRKSFKASCVHLMYSSLCLFMHGLKRKWIAMI